MEQILVFGETLPEAYHNALIALSTYGEQSDCADWNTKQKEVSLTFSVDNPLQQPMISKLFIGGPKELEQYRQEMLYGILDFEIEKGNWKYTYHDRMANYPIDNQKDAPNIFSFNQINFVINELKRNPSSRRAVILIRDVSEDAFSEDPACLQHIQYFIRDNKLHCKVLFRSNDACKASFMNAFALIQLQKLIADELQVEIGTYTHRANSYHCYAQDYNMLEGYIKRIKDSTDEDDLCFYYEDDWKDLMESYQEEIKNQVEELKLR